MTTQEQTTVRRFRTAALTGAGVALLCFAWCAWMIAHFNSGAASVRLGSTTSLGVASIMLPGPVLLAFVAWQGRHGFCRVIGWVTLPLVLIVGGAVAFFAGTQLRPPFSPGDYDAAVREAETGLGATVSRNTETLKECKQVLRLFQERPARREEIDALAARMAAAYQRLKDEYGVLYNVRPFMGASFDSRGVSAARRDHYLHMVATLWEKGSDVRVRDDSLGWAGALTARLRMLSDHWGAWTWGDDGRPVFADKALDQAYERPAAEKAAGVQPGR